MTDMTVHSLSHAVNTTSAIPPAQEKQEDESAQETPITTADMLEFSAMGLSSLSNPASLSRPLGAQILGFGSVTARQTAATTLQGGSTVTHFTTEYEWSYFDLVNGSITRSVSSGIGVLSSNGANSSSSSGYAGHTVCVTFDAASYRAGDLEKTLDSLAVSYEAKYVGLQSSFSGQELENQREHWKELYGAGKEEASQSLSKMLGKFLGQESQAAQTKKVYNSVQALFASFEAKYRSITTSQGSKGWLQADLFESSLSLKGLGAAGKDVNGGKDGLYTKRELEFAAVSISAYQTAVRMASLGGGGSEARQALKVSMLSMKAEMMAYRGLMGEDMTELLRESGETARKQLLDGMDTYLEKRREGNADQEQAFPAVDREMFDAVYNSVMKEFRRNRDVMSAIWEGTSAALDRLIEAATKTPAQRWSLELEPKGYWETFDNAAYQGGIHAFEADWQEFLEGISTSWRDLNSLA